MSNNNRSGKYNFVNNFNDTPGTNSPLVSFYQLATFPNPKTNKYLLRRFIIDENNNFKQIKHYQLSQTSYNKFLKLKKPNEYKLLAVYDFTSVNYPSVADILFLKSAILSNNYDYSGYAPF